MEDLGSYDYDDDDLDDDYFENEKERFEEFLREIEEDQEPPTPFPRQKVGKNAPCPCWSGKKLKHCCGKGP